MPDTTRFLKPEAVAKLKGIDLKARLVVEGFLAGLWTQAPAPASRQGAGFPGFPLKIVFPDLKVFFLEATRKKVFFLKEVQRLLGVGGFEIRWAAEDQEVEDLFCRFDFVVSRAFGSIQKLAVEGSRFARRGGMIVAMKGKKGGEEVQDSLSSLQEMKMKVVFLDSLRLPFLNHERTLIGLVKN